MSLTESQLSTLSTFHEKSKNEIKERIPFKIGSE
jgi:hypothetical protein